MVKIYPTTDEGISHRREENPATNLGPTEEGADHLLGHTKEAVQIVQGQDEGSECCSYKSAHATLCIMIFIHEEAFIKYTRHKVMSVKPSL